MTQNDTTATHDPGIEAIVTIGPDAARAFIPPLADYKDPSAGWTETEYRHVAAQSVPVAVGYWTGEPGEVSFDAWPYIEICSILSGRVAVEDRQGRRREYASGDVFMVPKGWAGKWLTLEAATKLFVAIG
jgi:uncharacterized cupin superfamily protein